MEKKVGIMKELPGSEIMGLKTILRGSHGCLREGTESTMMLPTDFRGRTVISDYTKRAVLPQRHEFCSWRIQLLLRGLLRKGDHNGCFCCLSTQAVVFNLTPTHLA